MEKPSILIVGAGAVGLVVGYHLSLGGTAVTFLVRPARRKAMEIPQQLYCYDDGQIKTYSGFEVVASPAEVSAQRFDYIVLTLDGAACRSPDGVGLLREVGDAIRNTNAVVVMCGVGIGLREHLLTTIGLTDDRLLEGTLGNISHQVSANLPLHPPTNPAVLARASMAYRHFSGRTGFMLIPSPRAAARRFAALYDRNGISLCTLVNTTFYRYYTNAFYCITFTWETAGWPDAGGLAARRDLVESCVAAMKDIASLSRFSWVGRAVRLLLTPGLLMRILRKAERDFLPLDVAAFNRFHHGGKVLAQDIEVMHNCLNEGRAEGRQMLALTELLREFDVHRNERNMA